MAGAIDSFFASFGFEVDTQKIDEFKKKSEELRSSVLKVGAIFTGVAAGIGLFVGKVAEGMAETQHFAEINNMSASTVDAFGKAAVANGSSVDAMRGSMASMNRVIGEAALGIGRGAMTFEKLGLKAKNSKGEVKDFVEMFGEIADKFKDLSAQEQISMAAKLGIDSSLIPMMRKGGAAFLKTAEDIKALSFATDKDYESAFKLKLLFAKMSAAVGGVTKKIAVGLMPVVEKAVAMYVSWIKDTQKASGGGMTTGINLFKSAVETAWEWVVRLIGGVRDGIKWLGQFKVITWATAAAIGAVIAYQAGTFFMSLASAVGTAAKALFTFNAAASLPVILVGGIVIAIALLIDELVNFYEGNDSVIAQLSEKFPYAIGIAWGALVALGGAFIALKWKAIASMFETMAIVAMYAAEWIAAHVAMGAGALVAYWPILLIIGAIAAAVGAVWYLWANWDKVTALLGNAWDVVKNTLQTAFNSVMAVFDSAKQRVMGFYDTVVSAIDKVGSLLGLTNNVKGIQVSEVKDGGSGSAQQQSPVALAAAQAPAFNQAPQQSPALQATGATLLAQPGGVLGRPANNTTNSSVQTTTNTTVHAPITVNSPDPARAGDSVKTELDRLNKQTVRNGQSAVAL